MQPEKILKEYETAQQLVAGARKALPTAKGFRERLEAGVAEREISPEATRREAEAIKKLFTAPTALRAELEETELSSLQKQQVISGRMTNWLDELKDIQTIKKNRKTRIDNIIKSVAAGYESEVAKKELDLSALEKNADDKWKEYTQSYREYNDTLQNQILGGLAGLNQMNKIALNQEIATKFTRGKDGGIDPKTYTEMRNKWINTFGTATEFDQTYPVQGWVETTMSPNAEENKAYLKEHNLWTPITEAAFLSKMSDAEVIAKLTQELQQAQTPEDIEKIVSYYESIGINFQDALDKRARAMKRIFQKRLDPEFYAEIFGGAISPSGEAGFTRPE